MEKHDLFNRLWSKAVNTDKYDKKEWLELEEIVERKYKHGMPLFYALLEGMARTHDRKSHDYASNDNPAGNYHFAGKLSQLFKNSDDAGFIGRIGEKLYRLANLENNNKEVKNESIEDTEMDLCVIMVLWMADRRMRRVKIEQDKIIS